MAAGRVRTALVVASEALRPALGSGHETAAGAGAVALVLRRDGAGARLDSVASRFEPLLDRYRGDDETETRDTYDSRLVREEAFMPLAADVIDRGACGRRHGDR